jgi:ribosomal protein S18 acetylase RimI-like enzyme
MNARPATHVDIPELVELMHEFYAESSFALDRQWAAQAFASLLDDRFRGAVWIVESDGTAAGHVVLTTRFAMEFGGLIGYIDDLFVRPGYRRRGAARVALDALVAECQRRGCRSLIVEVGPDNAGAIALYRRVGLRLRADARQTMEIVWPAAG